MPSCQEFQGAVQWACTLAAAMCGLQINYMACFIFIVQGWCLFSFDCFQSETGCQPSMSRYQVPNVSSCGIRKQSCAQKSQLHVKNCTKQNFYLKTCFESGCPLGTLWREDASLHSNTWHGNTSCLTIRRQLVCSCERVPFSLLQVNES